MARRTDPPTTRDAQGRLVADEAQAGRGRGDDTGEHRKRGRRAQRPQEVPAAGWKDIAWRVKDAIKRDRVALASAGVGFYAMLALFPALAALVSLYGLVADPDQAAQQIENLMPDLGEGAGELITEQVQAVAGAGQGALSLGLAISILAALWTASSGMNGLMEALTLAHNEEETRGFVKRRAIALALTLVGILIVALAIASIIVAPLVVGALGLGGVGEWAVRILRWPVLAAFLVLALSVVYRYAPNRQEPQWRWVSTGAIIATLLWIVASIAFSIYVQNFGNYNETYGALGGMIVLLLWLFLSSFVILLGAEINSESEHQTRHDTTSGEPRPMGSRGAHVADELGESRA